MAVRSGAQRQADIRERKRRTGSRRGDREAGHGKDRLGPKGGRNTGGRGKERPKRDDCPDQEDGDPRGD